MAPRRKKQRHKAPYVKPAHASQQRLLQTTCVYVMHNFPYFWLNKFGISDKPGARRKNVSETAPGYVFYLFAPNLLYGWECEGFVHTLYALQRVRFKGSGSSEWFMVFSPIVGTSFLIACHYPHISPSLKWYALAYFTRLSARRGKCRDCTHEKINRAKFIGISNWCRQKPDCCSDCPMGA